jgi:hypothetical protein
VRSFVTEVLIFTLLKKAAFAFNITVEMVFALKLLTVNAVAVPVVVKKELVVSMLLTISVLKMEEVVLIVLAFSVLVLGDHSARWKKRCATDKNRAETSCNCLEAAYNSYCSDATGSSHSSIDIEGGSRDVATNSYATCGTVYVEGC